MQKTLMERDHAGFEMVDSRHERRTLMGMNEDSFMGKIQGERKVFFRERQFSRKRKKCSMNKEMMRKTGRVI